MKVGNFEARVRVLFDSVGLHEFGDCEPILLFKGSKVLLALGAGNLLSRAILVSNGHAAVLLQTNALLSKVDGEPWKGTTGQVKYQSGMMFLRLVVEGVPQNLYCGRGQFHGRLTAKFGESMS